jgi:hypothetical protein
MRASWLALPSLLLWQGCASLDPAESYRAAARSLEYRLEAVHPRFDFQFPLDRSGLVVALDLGVRNPSNLRLSARSLGGRIHLDQGGSSFLLGEASFPGGVDLAPQSSRTLQAELRLPYGNLKAAWGALQDVVLHQRPATWRLEGKAIVEVLGVPFETPLRASRETGSPRP